MMKKNGPIHAAYMARRWPCEGSEFRDRFRAKWRSARAGKTTSAGPGGAPGPADELRSKFLSGLGEIQFDADAVGIVEENLGVAGARHDLLPERHFPFAEQLAHTLDVTGRNSDV